MSSPENGWAEWKNHVLKELETNARQHEEVKAGIARNLAGISEIKVTLAEMRGASRMRTALFSVGLPLVVSVVAALAAVFAVL